MRVVLMARADIDTGAIAALIRDTGGDIIGRAAERVERAAIGLTSSDGGDVHIRTAQYLNSFGVIRRPDGGAEIENRAPHAAWLELGTQPHTIKGNPMLRFVAGGHVVYAREVQHPGTKPYRILTRSLERVITGVLT